MDTGPDTKSHGEAGLDKTGYNFEMDLGPLPRHLLE